MSVAAASCAEDRVHAENTALGAILEVLRERTGADFSRYRSATVRRRVLNRMITLGADTFEHYLGILRERENEALQLLERITIKVSRFYRNKVTFDLLRAHVVPHLAATREGQPLRVWSAGCGCGEEAYTLAMLLEEARVPGVIEATDLDPAALDAARAARYPAAAFAELPEDLRAAYCEPAEGGFTVRKEVRARVSFSRHDLTCATATPGGGESFDLISCRNVLIYFDSLVQLQVLHELRRAIRGGGFLCLGEAEWPTPALAPTLEALGHEARVFRALPLDTAETPVVRCLPGDGPARSRTQWLWTCGTAET